MALWDFRNIFLLNTGEDQKKVLSERWAPGTVPNGKSVSGYYCISLIKRFDEGLS